MSLLLSFPIWEKLGGREEAIRLLEARLGKPLVKETVNRWVWKRKLPSKIAALCLDEAQARGMPAGLRDCEIRGVEHYKACRPGSKEKADE